MRKLGLFGSAASGFAVGMALLFASAAWTSNGRLTEAPYGIAVGHDQPAPIDVPADNGITTPEGPVPATSDDDLPTCEWQYAQNATAEVGATCVSGQRVVAGACVCSGNSNLERGVPFENLSFSDQPEDGELWYQTDGITGWTCRFDAACSAVHALALCCGD